MVCKTVGPKKADEKEKKWNHVGKEESRERIGREVNILQRENRGEIKSN